MDQILKTKRLVIRPIQSGDAGEIHAYSGDQGIDMMLSLPHETLADTERFVEASVAEWAKEEPENREYVILLEGRIIGGMKLELCLEERTYEIGWILHPEFRGSGYAAEAAEALQSYAFSALKAIQVQAHCDCRNLASVKVMKKLGMVLIDETGTRYYPKAGVTAGEHLYAIQKEAASD